MKLIKNAKMSGLTMIETLIAVVISIATLVFILTFTGKNISENERKADVADNLKTLMKAVINRIDVDSGIKNTTTTTYETQSELGNFIKLLNGKNTSCGSWEPDSPDDDRNLENINKQNINCGYFKANQLNSRVVAKVNNSENSISIIFDYEDGEMKDYLPLWSSISDELLISPETLGYGSQNYGFIDKVRDETITKSECASNFSNCAFKMSYRIKNESENQYLSTIGLNMQVGKIKFSNGMLNPQVCKNWIVSDSGEIQEQEDVFCGVENEDGKVSFKLNDLETDNVTVGGECRMLNIDEDNKFIGYDSGKFPCGLIKTKKNTNEGNQLIVVSITDGASYDSARTKVSSANVHNANVSDQELLTVGDSMEALSEEVKVLSFKVDSALKVLQVKSNDFKANYLYLYDLFVNQDNHEFRNLKSVESYINGISKINYLSTSRVNTDTVVSDGITYDGDLKITGTLNATDYRGIGILEADEIVEESGVDFNLRSSAFLGGYAETNGVENPDKVGITGLESVNVSGNYIQALTGSGEKIDLNSGGNTNFQINRSGDAQWIANGVSLSLDAGSINIDGSGISVQDSGGGGFTLHDSTYLRGHGLAGSMPSQILGDIIVSPDTFYEMIQNERFEDVIELTVLPTIKLDKLEPNAKAELNNFPNYATNSINNSQPRTHALDRARHNVYNRLIVAENIVTSGGPKGGTGEKGVRGPVGPTGYIGDTGAPGAQGRKGPAYNGSSKIWLHENQSEKISCLTPSEASSKGSLWTGNDVIEGLCSGGVKYWQTTTSCGDGKYNTEVFVCAPASTRTSLNSRPHPIGF